MTDTDDGPQYRHHHHPEPDDVDVREELEDDESDEMFSVRMPIASTGDVRNDGDDPLTRDELDGMARQLSDRQIGVFPEHGASDYVDGGRYSQLEKMGYWADADVVESRGDDDTDVLMADARMPDPETLSPVTGSYREALAIYKEQAKRGIALSSSIGWREDEDSPGGNDLMEASIVGIPADPRTDTSQSAETGVVARAAVEAGADPDQLVDAVRAAVGDADEDTDMTDDTESADDVPDEGGEQSADDGEPPAVRDLLRGVEEKVDRMAEEIEENTSMTREMYDQMVDTDDEQADDGDDMDDDEEEEEDEDDDEDGGGEQSADVAELREEIADLRERVGDADPSDPADEGRDADESDTENRDADENADDQSGDAIDWHN